MRLKIILPHTLIVILVGLLSYFVVRQRLGGMEDPTALKAEVNRGAQGASAVLQLQLLRGERWLAENGAREELRDRLSNLEDNSAARWQKTTDTLDVLKRAAAEASGTFPSPPDIVALVDKNGNAVGQSNNVQLYHKDEFGAAYPPLKAALAAGHSGSDLWLVNSFVHKHLVSYAPLRSKDGVILGAVVAMWSLDDRVASLSTGAIALVVFEAGEPKVRAKANDSAVPAFVADLESQKEFIASAVKSGRDSQVVNGTVTAIAMLAGVGDGSRAAIAVARPSASMRSPEQYLWPIFAAVGLGLIFVLIVGWILAGYVTEPVAKMEEVLLQVINGNTNQRIELEHGEFGGLAFRVNQLLNTVLGVEEETTDDDGRPSSIPTRQHFQEALSVDDARNPEVASALAAEDESVYFQRIYAEYIEAKRGLGEPVDGITLDVFTQRIRGMEAEQTAKLGRPVRYAVERRERQVVLLAIPLR